MGDEPEAAHRQLWVRALPHTHTHTHTHTLCVQVGGLSPEDDGRVQTTAAFLHGIHIRRVLASRWPSEASYPEYLLSLEDGLEPLGVRKRGRPHCGSSPQPPPNETSETGLFFLGPFSLPLLSFAPMFVGVLIKVLGFSKFCNKLDAPERCTGHSVFILSAQNWGGASCSLRSV